LANTKSGFWRSNWTLILQGLQCASSLQILKRNRQGTPAHTPAPSAHGSEMPSHQGAVTGSQQARKSRQINLLDRPLHLCARLARTPYWEGLERLLAILSTQNRAPVLGSLEVVSSRKFYHKEPECCPPIPHLTVSARLDDPIEVTDALVVCMSSLIGHGCCA